MLKNYFKRSLMLIGVSAAVMSATAGGKYVDVTAKYLAEPSYLPGWQGAITGAGEGVAEVWNGAFRAYQVLADLPAGDYTLTANAFYRCGGNDYAKEHMATDKSLYKAYIFINDTKQPVAGLFDGGKEIAPNNMAEANTAFSAGEYLNTVTAHHNGGQMIIGIANTGCYDDEWCCFDNFKLVGPNGEVALVNGDFSTGIDSKRAWNNVNADNGVKTPDMQKDGAGGGVFRKCGGSPYKYGQQVELPAGKYRFGMLTFHRYGSTLNPDGTYYNHKSGDVSNAYGTVSRTPKDWFDANDYDTKEYAHAYIFMSKEADCPKDLNWSEDFGDLNEATDVRTRIKDCWEICNGNYAEMPDNNPYGKEATLPYETVNKCIRWHDSGNEREAAAAFVANPEKWYQYVEFELTEPAKVWVGMGKGANTGDGYWQPWADQKLEKFEEEGGETPGEPVIGGDTEYVDVTTKYIKEPAYLPGWQGVLGAVGEGVGESWNGAFNLYQTLTDMPAGGYTLTVNAFYRCGNNDYSKANMNDGANHYAFVYINDVEVPVAGLFDGGKEVAPNSMAEANTAFADGEYLNTVKYTLAKAGDLKIGIVNKGGYWDEWCCFDNFKLVGPNGEVAIVNGDFSTGFNAERAWNCVNTENKVKVPDVQKDGSGAGTFRKCGGSPYKYGQQIELPAGKYRYGMLCFHRYGSEIDAAGNYYNHKWPCDIRPEGAYGTANRTPKDWFEANDYDTKDYAHAYIFMSKEENCPKDLNWSEDFGDLNEATDVRTRVKDCWEINNGDLEKMPHNNPVRIEGNLEGDWADVFPYEVRNKVIYRNDSGSEREAGAAFVNEPEKYYQYVEFTLTQPTKVWLGMGKGANSGDGYWHAWADQKLEMMANSAGVDDVIADEIADENAPVEYYNLQGIRVENPANGLYIKKQGNKATKVYVK